MKRGSGLLGAAFLFAGSVTGCGGPATPDGGMPTTTRFVASRLLIPGDRAAFAIDLNGDGKADNQLGNIIGALASQGLAPQPAIDQNIAEGGVILLLSVLSTDSTLTTATGSTATIYLGTKTTNPDFSGAGMFTIDATQTPAAFLGNFAKGEFQSANPVTATTANEVKVVIDLPLIAGVAPIALKVNGAELQFQSSGCPKDTVGFTTTAADGGTFTADAGTPAYCGALRGSICNKDVQTSIIPAVASLLTARIAADPTSDASKQILMLFDVGDGNGGNCTNPDGSLGKPGDNVISTCEVADNALVAAVLAPDIQVFTDTTCTTYMPNKANTTKDSLSLGIGFDFVKASFTEP